MQLNKIPTSIDYLDACQRCSSVFLEDLKVEEAITKVLAIAGEMSGADRVFIYQNTYNQEKLISFGLYQDWLQPVDSKGLERLKSFDLDWSNFSDIKKELLGNRMLTMSALQVNSNGISNVLRIHKSESIVVVPIFFNCNFWGFSGFDSATFRVWNETEIEFFKTISLILSMYLKRQVLELEVFNQTNSTDIKLTEGEWLNQSATSALRTQQIADLKNLAMIAQKSQSVVMLCNADFTIKWVNDAFTKTLGFTAQDALGKLLAELLSGPETDMQLIASVGEKAAQGISTNFEILNYTKDGNQVWVLVDMTPLLDANNQLTGFIIIETDISEKKKAEVEIRETLEKEKKLNTLKAKFVSLASHEFRTPLAGIQLSADIVKMLVNKIRNVESDTKAKLDKHVGRISSEIFRMAEMMNNVLLMGKIDADRIQYYPVKGDFYEFVNDSIKESFSELPNNRQIKLTRVGESSSALFDKTLMEHILKNLLSNALKYSEGGKDPEVTVQFAEQKIVLVIRDFGIGIPEEEKTSIFQSFFRASNAVSIQGIGLGMAIIKQFIELHAGTISFESKVNVGTTFTIVLPIN